MNLNRYVLSRAIQQHGRNASLRRKQPGDYGSMGDVQEIAILRGLYHADHGHLVFAVQEAGKIPQHVNPMFMLLYTDAVQLEDILELDGHTYRIAGMDDPGGLHLCLDLSLKEE